MPAGRPIPERYFRGQGPAKAVSNEDLDAHADADVQPDETEVVEPVVIDEYDLSEPFDFMRQVPSNFYDQLASPKWKERKEALDALLELVKKPKLQDGRYHELVSSVGKRVADVNVMVATVAANIIEAMASGLRQSFGCYYSLVANHLVERLKEKKVAIIDALRSALDQLAQMYALDNGNIGAIAESIKEAIGHKNPGIKAEVCAWAARCLAAGHVSKLKKEETKILSDAAVKALEDSDATVREKGAEMLGTLLKLVGERTLSPWLSSMDKLKIDKVREWEAKIQIKSVHPKLQGKSVAQSDTKKVNNNVVTRQNMRPMSVPPKAKSAPATRRPLSLPPSKSKKVHILST